MARRSLRPLILAFVCLAATAAAQDARSYDPPAHVSFVDGSVVLERDGTRDPSPGSMPLLAGDRLRTEEGRVEVLFSDGSLLHLDTHTVVDFQSDEVVRLLQGTIRLVIAGPGRDLAYRVDAPAAWVQIADPGEYRVAILRDGEVELAVLRGAAELVNEQGRSYIRAGERTYAAAGAAPSPPYVFNSAAWDRFDQWSEDRRAYRRGASAQYLPSEVRPYAAAFDHYGAWRYEQSYGYVWYPRAPAGWRPYHHGRWVSLRPYGWTWIAADPWGWPTHHFGRWGFSAGAWFWIPGRHWGPAWVSWAYAPSYVSWCPLGWNNRPVFNIVNVNIFGGRSFSPWYGWTVVPRRHFAGPIINVTNVSVVRVDQRVHRTFVVQERAPEVRYAVGRSAIPIRSTGRYAVPRGELAAGTADPVRRPDAGAAAGRRLPGPAREPGTRVEGGARASGAPAGTRAVPREGSAAVGPDAAGRTDSRRGALRTTAPPAGTRAVPREASGDAGPRDGAAGRTGSPEASRTTPPPAGVRAVPRESSGAGTGTWSREQGPSRTTARPASSGAAPDREAWRSAPSGGESRAVPRTRSGDDAGAARTPPAREYRRAPDAASRPPSSDAAAPPPARTQPPAGAIRAPRSSESDGANRRTAAPRDRQSERAPAYAPPSSGAVPPRTAPYGGAERAPGVRRAPDAAPAWGGRAAPRTEGAAPPPASRPAPTYRSAPAPREAAPARPSAAPPRSTDAPSRREAAPSRRSGDGSARAPSDSGPRARRRE